MTTLPFKLAIDPVPTQVLLTVRGDLVAADLETGRKTHNQTAGSDEGVAAARSLGDLSHAVFVPVEPASVGAGELLIIDYWNSVDGLRMFFSSPQVQQGGGMLYRDREAVVRSATPGLPRVQLPAAYGRNERYAGIVRGMVASREATEKQLTEGLRKQVNTARAKGLMSREFFFRATAPGEQPSLELIGLDIWFDADGMREVYSNPAEAANLEGIFTARPQTAVWRKPSGAWVEW